LIKKELDPETNQIIYTYLRRPATISLIKKKLLKKNKNKKKKTKTRIYLPLAIKNLKTFLFTNKILKINSLITNTCLFFNNALNKNVSVFLIFKTFDHKFLKIFNFFYTKIIQNKSIKNFSHIDFALKISFLI